MEFLSLDHGYPLGPQHPVVSVPAIGHPWSHTTVVHLDNFPNNVRVPPAKGTKGACLLHGVCCSPPHWPPYSLPGHGTGPLEFMTKLVQAEVNLPPAIVLSVHASYDKCSCLSADCSCHQDWMLKWNRIFVSKWEVTNQNSGVAARRSTWLTR